MSSSSHSLALSPSAYLLEKQPHVKQLTLYISTTVLGCRVGDGVLTPPAQLRVAVTRNHHFPAQRGDILLLTYGAQTSPAQTDDAATFAAAATTAAHAQTDQPPHDFATYCLPLDVRLAPLSAARHALLPSTPSNGSGGGSLHVLTLPYTADYAEVASADDFPTSRELQAKTFRNVRCRACGTGPLLFLCAPTCAADAPVVWSALPLPSPYWSELTELWVCHPEGGSAVNAAIDRLARSALQPRINTALLDRTRLLLHPANVQWLLLRERPLPARGMGDTNTDARLITCIKCHATLGEALLCPTHTTAATTAATAATTTATTAAAAAAAQTQSQTQTTAAAAGGGAAGGGGGGGENVPYVFLHKAALSTCTVSGFELLPATALPSSTLAHSHSLTHTTTTNTTTTTQHEQNSSSSSSSGATAEVHRKSVSRATQLLGDCSGVSGHSLNSSPNQSPLTAARSLSAQPTLHAVSATSPLLVAAADQQVANMSEDERRRRKRDTTIVTDIPSGVELLHAHAHAHPHSAGEDDACSAGGHSPLPLVVTSAHSPVLIAAADEEVNALSTDQIRKLKRDTAVVNAAPRSVVVDRHPPAAPAADGSQSSTAAGDASPTAPLVTAHSAASPLAITAADEAASLILGSDEERRRYRHATAITNELPRNVLLQKHPSASPHASPSASPALSRVSSTNDASPQPQPHHIHIQATTASSPLLITAADEVAAAMPEEERRRRKRDTAIVNELPPGVEIVRHAAAPAQTIVQHTANNHNHNARHLHLAAASTSSSSSSGGSAATADGSLHSHHPHVSAVAIAAADEAVASMSSEEKRRARRATSVVDEAPVAPRAQLSLLPLPLPLDQHDSPSKHGHSHSISIGAHSKPLSTHGITIEEAEEDEQMAADTHTHVHAHTHEGEVDGVQEALARASLQPQSQPPASDCYCQARYSSLSAVVAQQPSSSSSSSSSAFKCCNVFSVYDAEGTVAADLLARHHARHATRFVLADQAFDEQAPTPAQPVNILRVLLLNTDTSVRAPAFPSASSASAGMASVLKVGFSVHSGWDDPAVAAWVLGLPAPATAADVLTLPPAQLAAVRQALSERAGWWPATLSTALWSDMRLSALKQLARRQDSSTS